MICNFKYLFNFLIHQLICFKKYLLIYSLLCTILLYQIRQQLSNFRSVREKGLAHMYGDTYLPLHKLDTIMRAVDEITNKKLNSLLIEKDNAFKMLKFVLIYG